MPSHAGQGCLAPSFLATAKPCVPCARQRMGTLDGLCCTAECRFAQARAPASCASALKAGCAAAANGSCAPAPSFAQRPSLHGADAGCTGTQWPQRPWLKRPLRATGAGWQPGGWGANPRRPSPRMPLGHRVALRAWGRLDLATRCHPGRTATSPGPQPDGKHAQRRPPSRAAGSAMPKAAQACLRNPLAAGGCKAEPAIPSPPPPLTPQHWAHMGGLAVPRMAPPGMPMRAMHAPWQAWQKTGCSQVPIQSLLFLE